MYQGIIFGSVALLSVLILVLFRKTEQKKFDIFIKTLTVVFCAVGFCRYFLSDSFIYAINGAWYEGKYYDQPDFWQAILRWGYYTAYSVLPMAVFFKTRFFRNIASYITMPFAVLSAIFFDDYMVYFLSAQGHGYHGPDAFRYAYFVIELVFAILIPLLMQIKYKHYLNVKDRREMVNFFVGLPLLLLVTIPVYLPQALFGSGVNTRPMFGGYHFAWMGILLVVTLALYYAFRFRPRHDRVMLCMFLTLVLFFHYNSMYLMGVTIKRLPFQLCNIASYFYLIAMVFNLGKMFHFCFIVNVAGTILAIVAPTFSIGDTSFWTMHYIIEHSLVLIVPSLVMGLRIYPRVTTKSLKYAAIGFTCYFLFAFLLGTILNGYSAETGEKVNYFYMFDLELAFDYFPFLTFAGNYHFSIGRFEIYPIVVSIVYLGFTLIWFSFYLLVKALYKIDDDHLELRNSSIELYEKITNKTSRRPKEFVE